MKYLTILLIALSTCCTLGAQLLLKRVVGTAQARSAMAEGITSFIMHAAHSPITWVALSIQVAGYLVWLVVLSREKMAVAFATSGSIFYIITAAASWYFFAEKLTYSQWAGIILISTGVFLVAYRI